MNNEQVHLKAISRRIFFPTDSLPGFNYMQTTATTTKHFNPAPCKQSSGMVHCPLLGRGTMCSEATKQKQKQTKNPPDSCLFCVKHTVFQKKNANLSLFPGQIAYLGPSVVPIKKKCLLSGRLKIEILFSPWVKMWPFPTLDAVGFGSRTRRARCL